MNSLTLEDSIIKCARENSRRRSTTTGSTTHPRRRVTTDDSIPNIPRGVGSNNDNRSASFHDVSAATTTRRVSWSDRYSVSVFDGGKSPARIAAERVAQECHLLRIEDDDDMAMVATDVIAPLPFDSSSTNDGEKNIQLTMVTGPAAAATTSILHVPDDEVSYHHDVESISLSSDDISPTSGRHDDECTYYDIASYNLHLEMRSSSFTSDDDSTSVLPPKETLGYSLGDAPKCNQHMIIPTTHEEGIKYASTLQPLDFAFILCNDGKWTFSIVCEILFKDETEVDHPPKGERHHQPRLRFVLDREGSTKMISKKNWGHKIRLINQCTSQEY